MKRYLRLYLYFLRFSFSKALEFRLDFTFRILMDVVYYAVNILLYKVLYLHVGVIGGWTEPQTMIFVGSFLLVDAINMTVFSTNMWFLPVTINKGDLDYYLIRPVSPLFFLSVREFSASSFMNLLIAGSFFLYSLVNYPGTFSFSELFLFGVFLLNGVLIYFCIQLLMVLPVFWTHSARGFVDLFYTMGQAMERPDRVYRGWLRRLFTTVLPFTMIASFPVRLFLEGFDGKMILHITIISACLWAAVKVVWSRGLRAYSSASS